MPAAFKPPKNNPFELSVAMHDGRTDCDIWADGRAIASEERHLHGRAVANVSDAVEAKLSVERNENPPNRSHHANLVGWNLEDAKRLEQAANMAAVSHGEPVPSDS